MQGVGSNLMPPSYSELLLVSNLMPNTSGWFIIVEDTRSTDDLKAYQEVAEGGQSQG